MVKQSARVLARGIILAVFAAPGFSRLIPDTACGGDSGPQTISLEHADYIGEAPCTTPPTVGARAAFNDVLAQMGAEITTQLAALGLDCAICEHPKKFPCEGSIDLTTVSWSIVYFRIGGTQYVQATPTNPVTYTVICDPCPIVP